MSLKYALLGFLNYQAYSGYDLKQLMDVSTSNFWDGEVSPMPTLPATNKLFPDSPEGSR